MKLKLQLNVHDADRVYQQLIDLHQGLNDEASARLNCRLVLILLNHIGDEAVIADAMALARSSAPGGSEARGGT